MDCNSRSVFIGEVYIGESPVKQMRSPDLARTARFPHDPVLIRAMFSSVKSIYRT